MTKKYNFDLNDITCGRLQTVDDGKGSIIIAEKDRHFPFFVGRVFIVHPGEGGKLRGGHAHIKCQQVLVCISGSCEVLVDDGRQNNIYKLESPDGSLLVPAGIWATQKYFTTKTMLMVLCDLPYDEEDYIRDYKDFLAFRGLI